MIEGIADILNQGMVDLSSINLFIPVVIIILVGLSKQWKAIPLNKGNKNQIRTVVAILAVLFTTGDMVMSGGEITQETMAPLFGSSAVTYLLTYLGYRSVK